MPIWERIRLSGKDHFIDSNVFLGIALSNSYEKICKEYFHLDFFKRTSESVGEESKNVVHKLKNISEGILKFIGNYVEENNVPHDFIAATTIPAWLSVIPYVIMIAFIGFLLVRVLQHF